jgi:hypothetical protein
VIRARVLGCIAFSALVTAAKNAKADDSFSTPIAGFTASEGPRWGWSGPSAATMGGPGLFAGWRMTNVRMGALGRVDWWEGSRGPVVDTGLFIGGDLAVLFVDPQLSAAWFVRGEPAFRWQSNAGVWAFAPSGVTGLRALGIEIGLAGTYERWLSNLPGGAGGNGVVGELRMGLELIEFIQFWCQKAQGQTRQTP